VARGGAKGHLQPQTKFLAKQLLQRPPLGPLEIIVCRWTLFRNSYLYIKTFKGIKEMMVIVVVVIEFDWLVYRYIDLELDKAMAI
jgi:hypothetical protein